MNTRSTAIFAMISIIILLPALSSASDTPAQALSRYYGAHSPQGETNLIIDQVQDLVDSGNLSQKTGTYLQVMLKAAKNKFDQGKDNTAINQLQVFIHLVNKFVLDGQLSKEDGQELIENAKLLIEALQV
jgi:polyhydroxyalkanoate synthesis regulator phasin